MTTSDVFSDGVVSRLRGANWDYLRSHWRLIPPLCERLLAERATRRQLLEALAAYRSAVRSGERESPHLRKLSSTAVSASLALDNGNAPPGSDPFTKPIL